MKSLIMISLAGFLFAGAGQAQSANAWFEQWFQAKYGRPSPMEEARRQAAKANVAFRDDVAPRTDPATAVNWQREQWFQAKFGRPSPVEEARRKAALANTAFRDEEVAPQTSSTNWWRDQWFRAKFGRPAPR